MVKSKKINTHQATTTTTTMTKITQELTRTLPIKKRTISPEFAKGRIKKGKKRRPIVGMTSKRKKWYTKYVMNHHNKDDKQTSRSDDIFQKAFPKNSIRKMTLRGSISRSNDRVDKEIRNMIMTFTISMMRIIALMTNVDKKETIQDVHVKFALTQLGIEFVDLI